MNVCDVSDDGSVCAVLCDDYLTIFDVCTNKLIWTVEERCDTSKTKIMKISPSKETVALLHISQLSFIHIRSRTASKIKSHTDFSVEYVLWNPDGNILAAFSSLSLFIDIYMIEQDCANHVASVSGAKLDNIGCPIAQFSPDGSYFSTVNISNKGSSITMYCTENASWNCVQRVFSTSLWDVGGLLWCVDSASLLLWQSGIELRLQLWTLDGRMEWEMTAATAPVTSISLSKCGRMAAVHSADKRVRILDLLTWQLGAMGVLVHCPIVHMSSSRCRLKEKDTHSGQINICEPITAALCELNYNASRSKRHCLLMFSSEAQYLATYEPVFPNTVWVWSLTSEPLLDTLIILRDDTFVHRLLWHSCENLLVASLTQNRVLVWTPQQTCIVNRDENTWLLTAETYLATLSHSNNDTLSLP